VTIFGTGLPRSGTTMLARCLNVITPSVHHECRTIRNRGVDLYVRRWLGGENVEWTLPIDMDVEVGFFWTFFADQFEGKVVHMWRPVQTWLDSAMSFDLWPPGSRAEIWVGEGNSHLMDGDAVEWMLRAYRQHNEFILDNVPNAYIISPDRIVWEDLLDWLGMDYTNEQIRSIQSLQRSRPNKAKKIVENISFVMDESTREVERRLDAATKFSREEAAHRL